MARRYADGRSSYAPGRFNDHVRALQGLGFEFHNNAPLFARDGMGRDFDRLTEDDVRSAELDMPKGHAQAVAETEERISSQLTAANKRIEELTVAAKCVVGHWNEFGPGHDFAHVLDLLERTLSLSDQPVVYEEAKNG